MDLKDLTESAKRQLCYALQIGLLKEIRNDIENKVTHKVDSYEEVLEWINSNFDNQSAYLKSNIEVLKKIDD